MIRAVGLNLSRRETCRSRQEPLETHRASLFSGDGVVPHTGPTGEVATDWYIVRCAAAIIVEYAYPAEAVIARRSLAVIWRYWHMSKAISAVFTHESVRRYYQVVRRWVKSNCTLPSLAGLSVKEAQNELCLLKVVRIFLIGLDSSPAS